MISGASSIAAPRAAGRLGSAARRLWLAVPAGVQERLLRGPLQGLAARLESGNRLGGLDWSGTLAFSDEVNTCPGIWLNVRSREPAGRVAPGDEYERLRAEMIARLLEWRHPETGLPVMARAWPREELYHGTAVEDAPDIILEPALDRGYAYTVLPGGRAGEPLRQLSPAERLGAKGGSMNGSHRPEGVLIVAGPGVRPGTRIEQARIVDVAPSLLHLLGVALPATMDGRVLSNALPAAWGTPMMALSVDRAAVPDAGSEGGNDGSQPIQSHQAPEEDAWPGGTPYSAREAATVDKTLRGLGYRP